MTNLTTVRFVLLATAVSQVLLAIGGNPGVKIAILVYLLAVPGFAATLHMGPMGPEARILVSVAASVTLGTLVSGALVLAHVWSPIAGFEIIAGIALVLTFTCGRSESAFDRQPSQPGLRETSS